MLYCVIQIALNTYRAFNHCPNKMKIGWIQLAIVLAHRVFYGNAFRQILLKRETSQQNIIYYDAVLFTVNSSSTISCASACQMSSAICTGFSFTSSTSACRGYSNAELTNPSFLDHTSSWKKVCRLEALGYIYDSTFETCLKFYEMEGIKDDASNACENDGANLIIPDTVQKLSALTSQYSDILSASDWWWAVGYDYSNSNSYDFRWDDGRPINNTLWHPGEPNASQEKCVCFTSSVAALFDRPCDVEAFYICQETV